MRAPPFLTTVTASQVHRGLLYKIGWATIAHAGAVDQITKSREQLVPGQDYMEAGCLGSHPFSPLFDIHVASVSASIVGFLWLPDKRTLGIL